MLSSVGVSSSASDISTRPVRESFPSPAEENSPAAPSRCRRKKSLIALPKSRPSTAAAPRRNDEAPMETAAAEKDPS
jgi:hypothetical protein